MILLFPLRWTWAGLGLAHRGPSAGVLCVEGSIRGGAGDPKRRGPRWGTRLGPRHFLTRQLGPAVANPARRDSPAGLPGRRGSSAPRGEPRTAGAAVEPALAKPLQGLRRGLEKVGRGESSRMQPTGVCKQPRTSLLLKHPCTSHSRALSFPAPPPPRWMSQGNSLGGRLVEEGTG